MGQVLSQEEVDALLQGINEGDVPVEQKAGEGGATAAKVFDLANQDRIIRGRMPTLEMLHDRFCRFFRNGISNMLRRPVDVSVLSSEMLKYGEFMRTVPVPTSMHVFRMEPLKGYGLLVVEGKLVFALIDHFLGGRGTMRYRLEGRDFTTIEQRIIRKVVELILEQYHNAWQPVHKLNIVWSRAESNPQFAAICAPTDLVWAVQCELDLEESQGNITFILPYSCLEPIKDRLKAGFQTEHTLIDRNWQIRMREQIKEVVVDCHVELGHTTVTGRQLLNLRVGDVVKLDEDISQPVPIYIEDVPKYEGYLGSYHGNCSVQVSRMIPLPKGEKVDVGELIESASEPSSVAAD